ncbi:META domain-containing protein [uncultured Shewanella sp.]|uniref:META domain-containing protein n=1 Tax=uncultured Shewanella sp. TaxID=173975 RepID=UPI0026311F46|nr:META domain-containing protein [uncultured Shewanella sp.]
MVTLRLIQVSVVLLLTGCQSTGVTVDNQLKLEGAWHIEKINGQSVVNYSPAKLNFSQNGVLSGNNSCNTFSGNYTFIGDALTLAPEAGTMKACVDALESQEKQVMTLMPKVTQARLVKTQLLLQDEDDKTLFILNKTSNFQDDNVSVILEK